MSNGKFELIIPVAEGDLEVLKNSIHYLKLYLVPQKVIIISSAKAAEKVGWLDKMVEFIDEDTLYPGLTYGAIKIYMEERGYASRKIGWYFQQFLKMAYAYRCKGEYYLSWDADTIPLRDISFFDAEDKPIFSLKKEYHKSYFDTIYRMLGLNKMKTESFIAEHMLFKKDFMLELIDKIGKNRTKTWFFNILENINTEDLISGSAGFSEFETYGTYVAATYPNYYSFRTVRAIRNGKCYFDTKLDENVMKWLGKDFFSITFEKRANRMIYLDIYKNEIFRKIISARLYERICAGIMRLII